MSDEVPKAFRSVGRLSCDELRARIATLEGLLREWLDEIDYRIKTFKSTRELQAKRDRINAALRGEGE